MPGRPRPDRQQLAFDFTAAAPRHGGELLARLREEGLEGIERLRLTRNRSVMVSFRAGELRVHEGYLGAPPHVLRAIALFVSGRTRSARRAAQAVILAHRIERPPRESRPERVHPDDEAMVRKLAEWHRRYNAHFFGGALRTVRVRVSRRLRRRLGHYSAATPSGEPSEIVISRRHIRRHGWDEALHTLLHEMVHQWQDETGQPIDHGAAFRAKAREVGVTPSARRALGRENCAPHERQSIVTDDAGLPPAREA
jgi:hypothetical protein